MCDKHFSHLHVHTEYSRYDGISNIKQITKKAAELGMKHLAITDHGTLGGAIKFYEACKINNIKPIIGCEGYICSDRNNEFSPHYHLLVLAKNNTGYKNLIKLISKSHLEGYGGPKKVSHKTGKNYRDTKPRFDFNDLANHGEGLIVSSACILSELSQALLHKENPLESGISIAKKYKEAFGENYYLEHMYQGQYSSNISEDTKNLMEDQKRIISGIREISKRLDIKEIVTNDVHYVCQEDHIARFMKMKINTLTSDKDRDGEIDQKLVEDTLNYHLKSQEDMWSFWGDHFSQALLNTYEIGEQCNIEIPLLSLGDAVDIKLPDYNIPYDEEFQAYLDKVNPGAGSSLDVHYVKYLVIKELTAKGLAGKPEYVERLKYELSVVSSNPAFCRYFLITKDFVDYAKSSNIYVGPGRGSGCGSLILYLLGITSIDPLEHKLDFERFLSSDEKHCFSINDLM